MFLAAIIACSGPMADTCTPYVNQRVMFESYEACLTNADEAAQVVMDSGNFYFVQPHCFQLQFGELASADN
jgi:hypothetical protein